LRLLMTDPDVDPIPLTESLPQVPVSTSKHSRRLTVLDACRCFLPEANAGIPGRLFHLRLVGWHAGVSFFMSSILFTFGLRMPDPCRQ
jgi:hypothetical protein